MVALSICSSTASEARQPACAFGWLTLSWFGGQERWTAPVVRPHLEFCVHFWLEPRQASGWQIKSHTQSAHWLAGGRRKVKVKSLSLVRLFVTPWTVTYQAPWSMGFSRQEYWSGLPFPSPGDLPNPGIEPGSPALQTDALPSEPLEVGIN